MASSESSLLEKLDSIAPLKEFDAFPKLPATYTSKSEGRGFITIFVALLSVLLVLNDVSEYLWGWTEHDYAVDLARRSYMPINVDVTVNMPCENLSVDLRDAMGDRLHLSDNMKLEATYFDVSQAQILQNHTLEQSATEVVRASRKSQGFFSFFSRSKQPEFRPTYKHFGTGKAQGSACRIYGNLFVKKVTANLHITTLGHGYTSHMHTDHSLMNLSHVISEFSFGPYFPHIIQPLDNSFEVATQPFVAFQYFLNVVPTTYLAPRTYPLRTNQYSVTHYVRPVEHGRATPGIFFKFDMDPMQVTIRQQTTTLIQLVIRVVGVVGGVWVCMGWAVKIGGRAIEIVAPPSRDLEGIVAAEATGVSRKRWAGGDLRARPGHGAASPHASYAGTPVSAGFAPAPASPYSPYSAGPGAGGFPRSPAPGQYAGFPPSPAPGAHSFASPPPSAPGFPQSPGFPPSPGPRGLGFATAGAPSRQSGLRVASGPEDEVYAKAKTD